MSKRKNIRRSKKNTLKNDYIAAGKTGVRRVNSNVQKKLSRKNVTFNRKRSVINKKRVNSKKKKNTGYKQKGQSSKIIKSHGVNDSGVKIGNGMQKLLSLQKLL